MTTRNLLRNTCILALICAPASAFAAPDTGPVFTVGGVGSYDKFKLEGGRQTASAHAGQGGVFATFGNKMTAESGLIYQVGIEGKYGEKDDERLKEGLGELDIGLRAALDARNFVDLTVGGGYTWSRYEPHVNGRDTTLTAKSPFAKAALGYNHQFDNATLRLEVGARRTLDGRATLDIDDAGSDRVDLKDETNPFAELSLLMNQNGSLPVHASVYYTRTDYDLEGGSPVADNTRLKRDEYGVKLGLVF